MEPNTRREQVQAWIDNMTSDDPERVASARSQLNKGRIPREWVWEMGSIIIETDVEQLVKICSLVVDPPIYEVTTALLHRATDPDLDSDVRNVIVTTLRQFDVPPQYQSRRWEAGLVLCLLCDVVSMRVSGGFRWELVDLILDLATDKDPTLLHFLLYILDKSPAEVGEAVVSVMAKIPNPVVLPLLLGRLKETLTSDMGYSSMVGAIHPRAYANALVEIGSDEAIVGCIDALHEAAKYGQVDDYIATALAKSDDARAVQAVEEWKAGGRTLWTEF